jgi:hypothetical protein
VPHSRIQFFRANLVAEEVTRIMKPLSASLGLPTRHLPRKQQPEFPPLELLIASLI